MAEETDELTESLTEEQIDEKIEKALTKALKKILGIDYDSSEEGDNQEEYIKFIDDVNLDSNYDDFNTIKELADTVNNLETTLNSKIDNIKNDLENQISDLSLNVENQLETQKSEFATSVSELSTNVTNQLETQKNEINESVTSNLEAQSNAISESLNAQQETITASLNTQQETINTIFGQVVQVQEQTNSILQNLYTLIENELTTMGERRNIIRDCAIALFTNTNFDTDKRSTIVIAKECVAKALLMTKEIKDQKIIE